MERSDAAGMVRHMTSGCTNVGVQPDNEVGACPAALRGHQWRFGLEASRREKATG